MRLAFAAGCLALACGSSGAAPAAGPEPIADGRSAPPPAAEPAAATHTGDAPEISRSVGKPGGVVVLWPRIVMPRGEKPDAPTRALAGAVQQRVAELARRALPGKDVDVRPEPERVCPRSGCQAASVGVLLARAGAGCAVLALVSAPGTSPSRIVPWSGVVKLDADQVPFREHAEPLVHVTDYGSCAKLPGSLADSEAQIEQAVKGAAGN